MLIAGAWMACGVCHAAVAVDAEPKEWPANSNRHQVVIERIAKTDAENQHIALAESTLPAREAVTQAFAAAPTNKDKPLPADKNLWWYAEQIGVKLPYAVTGEAVDYYKGLVEGWKMAKRQRYVEPASKLSYTASVKFEEVFKQDGKAFEKVHVVTLKLEFNADFTTEGTMALRFSKTRQVVISAGGKVLAVFGDGKTEAPLMAI